MNSKTTKPAGMEIFQKMKNGLKVIMELSKIRVTVAVSLTTLTGYVLAGRSYDTGFMLPVLGIFLIACGASVLNQIQERRTDALMHRTLSRPVPAHKISVSHAFLLAIVEIGAGTAVLVAFSDYKVLLLGYLALIWYNILYINLKKVTPHAVVPGSLIGTIPPLMGWMAAGGSLWNMHVLMMTAFFFIWQVPHFYLLSLKYGSEYELAGFPTIQQRMPAKRIHRMIFLWVLLTTVSGNTLLCCGFLRSFSSLVLIPAGSLWLLYTFLKTLQRHPSSTDYARYFMRINIYFLGCVLLMITDPLSEQLLDRVM